jgi:hypothetical protein
MQHCPACVCVCVCVFLLCEWAVWRVVCVCVFLRRWKCGVWCLVRVVCVGFSVCVGILCVYTCVGVVSLCVCVCLCVCRVCVRVRPRVVRLCVCACLAHATVSTGLLPLSPRRPPAFSRIPAPPGNWSWRVWNDEGTAAVEVLLRCRAYRVQPLGPEGPRHSGRRVRVAAETPEWWHRCGQGWRRQDSRRVPAAAHGSWCRKCNARIMDTPQWPWSKFGTPKETWVKLAARIGW